MIALLIPSLLTISISLKVPTLPLSSVSIISVSALLAIPQIMSLLRSEYWLNRVLRSGNTRS